MNHVILRVSRLALKPLVEHKVIELCFEVLLLVCWILIVIENVIVTESRDQIGIGELNRENLLVERLHPVLKNFPMSLHRLLIWLAGSFQRHIMSDKVTREQNHVWLLFVG